MEKTVFVEPDVKWSCSERFLRGGVGIETQSPLEQSRKQQCGRRTNTLTSLSFCSPSSCWHFPLVGPSEELEPRAPGWCRLDHQPPPPPSSRVRKSREQMRECKQRTISKPPHWFFVGSKIHMKVIYVINLMQTRLFSQIQHHQKIPNHQQFIFFYFLGTSVGILIICVQSVGG